MMFFGATPETEVGQGVGVCVGASANGGRGLILKTLTLTLVRGHSGDGVGGPLAGAGPQTAVGGQVVENFVHDLRREILVIVLEYRKAKKALSKVASLHTQVRLRSWPFGSGLHRPNQKL